jgi:hypothetical protein
MSGVLGPVLPYFMIASLVLTSAIPTMEKIHGTVARQYARVALAIVGISDPMTYRFYEDTGNTIRELFPSGRDGRSLTAFDETQEVPTAQEWRKVQNHLGNLERLGDRLAKQLEGKG